MEGWYYLHSGGDIIWKGAAYVNAADLRGADFVVAFWPFREGDQEAGWTMLVEALAAGANDRRVAELAAAWGMDDASGAEYARRINVTLAREDDHWLAVPEATASQAVALSLSDLPPAVPVGRGPTVLAALAALATACGWRLARMGPSFPDAVNRQWAEAR